MSEAIALCRVSSKEQLLSNSLDLQGVNVQTMAEKLGVPIVKKWALHTSSRKGKNLKRRDLVDAKNLCRKNKNIKYILFDRVNRLGREAKYLTFYMLDLEINHGVQLVFCDPSQQSLNGADTKTFLKRVEKLVEGEVENEEKSSLSINRMRNRVILGYYPFNTHAGYRKTEAEDGLHVPDEPIFSILKKGCKLIIYKNHTPKQATRWMNENGFRTKGGRKLDTEHFSNFIVDTYYCGVINVDKPGWPTDVAGLHFPLLSKREHHILVTILLKRNPRIRYEHNPEFMLGNLLRHKECQALGGCEKFCGHFRNPGKRPSGTQRPLEPVYDCRDCRKRLGREKVHNGFSSFLDSLQLVPDRKGFKDALVKVWRNQRGSMATRLNTLEASKSIIEKRVKDTTETYAIEKNEVIKSNLGKLLRDYDTEIKEVELEIHQAKNVDLESEDFVKFAVDFVDKLRERWWKLSWENMKRGEQILFNGKIYMDNSAVVHPSDLSSIYTLGTNKKALSNLDNTHLVELASTALACISLSKVSFLQV